MNIDGICPYETPCGWCAKWDKKCDKKIGCNTDNKPQRGLRANAGLYEEATEIPTMPGKCFDCVCRDYDMPQCNECLTNDFKYFQSRKKATK